jgi:hypothetical protein
MTLSRPTVDYKIADKARPKHGTEFGDAFMGNCVHPNCGNPHIKRADAFVVTQAKDLYHTKCWQTVRAKRLRGQASASKLIA